MGFLASIKVVGKGLVYVEPLTATDPGFGGGRPGGGDPDYGMPDWGSGRPDNELPGGGGHPWLPGHRPDRPDQGLPGGGGRPGNALPIPPVRPSPPITLPPGVWPPQLPPGVDNTLPPPPPGQVAPPIVIPPGEVDNELPINIPSLPAGMAILIALPAGAQPKGETPPPNTKPAILVQAGKKPVLVYVSAAPMPK